MLGEQGIPFQCEVGQSPESCNCVTPDTKIMMWDLSWKKAGDLKKGDKIVGFDDVPKKGKRRQVRQAEVICTGIEKRDVFKITFEDGSYLRSTPEHRWIIYDCAQQKWERTDVLFKKFIKGNNVELPKFFNVNTINNSREAGYLAGVYDGEGCLSLGEAASLQISFIQNRGEVLDLVRQSLDNLGYKYTDTPHGKEDCRKITLIGGRSEFTRFLAEIRPIRFLKKFYERIESLNLEKDCLYKVVNIEKEIAQEIVTLSSSTETYIAEGFAAHNTYVLEFPCKAPVSMKDRDKEDAIEQLEYWKMLRTFWCEHNPSITVSVKEEEWVETAAWVYKHFDDICGVSFLPSSDHVYQLAPYEDITKEQYEKLINEMPVISFDRLSEYELEDATLGSKEYACQGGSCELI